ncbi:hypothetical protein [Herbaspirillum sp. RV1423]|uniref:hypothetical protein n=1 Tax=Herbaspirillum sp. RV1423 TaxID=1443993 RepID=UPI0004AE6529|nr:hypothetical protein [Herbaspirillum sp. RV1423]
MKNPQPQSVLQDGSDDIDYAANLALFLLEHTGSIYGEWHGKMKAADQRELMGRFLGKGTIVINGLNETVRNRVSVCFGHDWDDRNIASFASLEVAQADNEGEHFQEATAGILTVQRSGRRMLVCGAAA